MEIAQGIHRVESSLGARFMAQYVLVGEARTLLLDTGMPFTPGEALAPVSRVRRARPRRDRRGR